jgi:TIR domain
MAEPVLIVRASPRWPAAGERFDSGWTSLVAARRLLERLCSGTTSDGAGVEEDLLLALADVRETARVETVALLTEDGAEHESATRSRVMLLRQVTGDLPKGVRAGLSTLALPDDEAVVPALVAVLGDLVSAKFAAAVPLARSLGDAHTFGWIVALSASDAEELHERAEHARTVLEEIAWAFALALRTGWGAWDASSRSARPWPDLDGGELGLCEVAREGFPTFPVFHGTTSDLPEAEGSQGHGAEVELPYDLERAARTYELDYAEQPMAEASDQDAESPRTVDENVQFTVYRPRCIPPETWCPILAFAHLAERRPDAPVGSPDPVEEVRRQAEQVLGDLASTYSDAMQDSSAGVPREGEITFVLDVPDLAVNPRSRSFRWLEDIQREEFHVRAPAALDGKIVRGALHVYLGAIVLAKVVLAIRVDRSAPRRAASDAHADEARPYRRIFPSYSHLDEAIVQQVEAYARTLGDEYLRDVTHLRSGEVWSERLAEFIRTADVFQLFWSHNSMDSRWVRQEWEYALSLGRAHFVRPTYWETPMPEAPERGMPPDVLRTLHFQRLPVMTSEPAQPSVPRPASVPPPSPVAPASPVTAPVPPARRASWMPRLAVAAVLFVGLVGGTITWRMSGTTLPPATSTDSGGTPPAPAPVGPLAAISPDGRFEATMDAEARIIVSRRATPGIADRIIKTTLSAADVVALRFSRDGTRIACETRDGKTVEWDVDTGERVGRATAPDGSASRAGAVVMRPSATAVNAHAIDERGTRYARSHAPARMR